MLIFVLLIFISPLFSQEYQIKFDHLTIDQGLSHSKVNCIYQDSRGFLWFGTNEGLNRYDGYDFTVFQKEPNQDEGLSANLIRCIIEDRNGLMWIGTEAGGVNIYDRKKNAFHHFKSDSASDLRISDNDVNWIVEDNHGYIWLGTGRGIDRIDLTALEVKNYLLHPETKQPELNEVSVMYIEDSGKFWIGTFSSGLILFNPENDKFANFQHDRNDPSTVSDNDIRSIYKDMNGNLWIGTYSGGLNLFNRKTGGFTQYYFDKDIPETRSIKAILDFGDGTLWVGTRSGLYLFDPKSGTFERYVYDPNNAYSISQNNIMAIFRDRRGDIWIGTWGGVNYRSTIKSKFLHLRADAKNPKHLNHSVVYAILEDRHRNLWFGTEEGGVNFLNRKTGTFRYYKYDPENPSSLSSANIKALVEDRRGNIWIGTYQGGVNILDPRSGKCIHYKHNPADPGSLSDDDVFAILIDSDDIVWIGTNGGGLNRFDPKKQRFVRYKFEGEYSFDDVYALHEDSNGTIWMGGNERYVGRLDKRSGKLRTYKLNIDISGIEVRSIHEDKNGNLYFCTIGGGLHFLDVGQDTFKIYSKTNGLSSNIIHGILEDAADNLWISSSNGLSKLTPATGDIKTFYRENGIQSNQFCYNAFCKTRAGELLFGGINGVTMFQPEDIKDNTYLPPVVITDFKIFSKSVKISDKDGILQNHISETKEISLNYKHSVISFEFSALNYFISKQNKYAYIMEGFDADWNYVNEQRIATYTNLDPGEYVFRVKAANNDGYWNEEGASVQITISPPFWKTIWFKFILAGLIGLVIFHLMSDQKRRRDILRANSLANLNQLKLLRSQMNPHFLFNALGSIRSMILIDKDRAWQMISELSEFFRYSLQTFNKIGSSLDGEIEAAHSYLNIEKIRFRESLKVTFNIDDNARDCIVPVFTLQPLIENAIKHGMQTSKLPLTIVIDISFHEEKLTINIANTGKLLSQMAAPNNDSEIHGTAIENIKKRLQLMFEKNYTFELFEEEGWVHAKMVIDYRNHNGRVIN